MVDVGKEKQKGGKSGECWLWDLRNKGKGLPSYITKERRTRAQVIQQKQSGEKTILGCGREFRKYRQLGGTIVVEENSVEMVLTFSKEKGVEDLGIEPKLHCNHFLEVWHLFLVKTCCNYHMMMLA